MLATSPAANTFGSVTVCSVSVTCMKPSASRARPVSRSQGAPPARVTQTISSASTVSPLAVRRRVADTCLTSALQRRTTPRSASARSKARRTLALWVGSMTASRVSRWKLIASGLRPAACSSLRKRYCIASVSSTPPAPPPTTAMRVAPACRRTRSSSSCQRSLKPLTGFTGSACSAAPATPLICGVEPMLIDRKS